ncbi:MAG: putative sulfate exporter family transporter [Verrucomicrobia bacterium]|nr:MAG: putative sulfate exporter family transporter [Verrucomicrobiota bacterium]
MSPTSPSGPQNRAGKTAARKISEDVLALMVGLFLFLASLAGFAGVDIFGWAVKTSVWTEASQIMTPVSKNYPLVKGIASLIFTYLLMLTILTAAAKAALRVRFSRFVNGFTLVFFISYACFALGHFAYIAATPVELKKFGIPWSLNLTGEAGFIVALIAGLVVGNFLPRLANLMKEAIRPELYIKIAIVLLGATLGVKSAEAMGLARAVMFRGLCAIVEAYLIYWALVYFVARKYFRFSREWAAPLASGISICGVSAAIATGAAIRARPIVPIMVSSLVVVFAVVELLFLPFAARYFLQQEPMVAAAWMGLAVKTDGAAVASGTITESLIRAGALAAAGVKYQEGWMTMTTTTVKVFIDMFIGVWSFVLAILWCSRIENRTGERVRAIEIWERFPKFVLGYALTFVVLLLFCLNSPARIAAGKSLTADTDVLRVLFFVLTFFTIGVVSDFRRFREEGLGRLAAVYLVCLFGFIIWIGLIISWLFFHGVKPPVAIG